MEKALTSTVFIICSLLSCKAFAIEETYTYGSKTSTEPLSFNDWHSEWSKMAGGGGHAQVAGSAYSNYRASLAKVEARAQCKAKNEREFRDAKLSQLKSYNDNTSTCNNYNILAAAAGVTGYVTSVPTFGFTAAAASSAAVSLAAAAQICQSNADGAYAELSIHTEYTFKNYEQQVCDKIK